VYKHKGVRKLFFFLSGGIYSASSNDETCYIVAKKLIYQSKVIKALRIKGNCGIGRVMVELQQFLKFPTN
jgi:hypothetical protein